MQTIARPDLGLTPPALELIGRLENALGRTIIFARETAPYAEASQQILDDGTPVIFLRYDGRREINIMHELLHLECEAEGFPRTITRARTKRLPIERVSQAVSEVQSMIEHRTIYPKLVALGYDPYVDVVPKITRLMASIADRKAFFDRNPDRYILENDLTIQAARVILEAPEEVKTAFLNCIVDFKTEYRKALAVAKLISGVAEWTPIAARTCLVECLKALNISEASYAFCA